MSSDFTRKKKKIECKPELVISSLHNFYTTCKYIDKILPYLTGDTEISLRLIDWFVTNYCRKYLIGYPLDGQEFVVYLSYKSQLRAYSKQLFDPNCRRERIIFEIPGHEPFLTTVGKLNFFRWAFESNVIQYIEAHLEEIEKERDEDKKQNKHEKGNTESSVDSTSSIKTAPLECESIDAINIGKATRRRRNKAIPTMSCHIQSYPTEVQISFD